MIRNFQALLLVALFIFSSGAVLAQEPSTPDKPPKKKIKTMIDYKDELDLTEEQVKEVRTALLSFQTTVKQLRATLAQSEKDYKQLVKEEAPLSDIKSTLRTIADARFQLRYADVVTSRRVSDALTDQQMAKWREIQTKVRVDEQAR
jgi:septal ring factor EnvC (AmiA/AmiB activator)